jgi:hypothetical protein
MRSFPLPRRMITDWAVASQQGARRNAMVACTRLAQRRAERLQVEEFLASRGGRPAAPEAAPPPGDVPAPRAAGD